MEKYVTPMRAKRLLHVLLAGLLFIGGVLGLAFWKFNEPLELPTPSGPFGVGRVVYSAEATRNLPLVVWYPIDKGSPV